MMPNDLWYRFTYLFITITIDFHISLTKGGVSGVRWNIMHLRISVFNINFRMPWVGLHSLIEAFPGHTHYFKIKSLIYKIGIPLGQGTKIPLVRS